MSKKKKKKKKKMLRCSLCNSRMEVVWIEQRISSRLGTVSTGVAEPWCITCREQNHGRWQYHDRGAAHKANLAALAVRRRGKKEKASPGYMHRVTFEELRDESENAERKLEDRRKSAGKDSIHWLDS